MARRAKFTMQLRPPFRFHLRLGRVRHVFHVFQMMRIDGDRRRTGRFATLHGPHLVSFRHFQLDLKDAGPLDIQDRQQVGRDLIRLQIHLDQLVRLRSAAVVSRRSASDRMGRPHSDRQTTSSAWPAARAAQPRRFAAGPFRDSGLAAQCCAQAARRRFLADVRRCSSLCRSRLQRPHDRRTNLGTASSPAAFLCRRRISPARS